MSTQPKKAFITGASGQDGFYLSEYLLKLGYEVLGLVQSSDRTKSDTSNYALIEGDLCNPESFFHAIEDFIPNEVYNLAAVSDIQTAIRLPDYTYEVNFLAFKKVVNYLTSEIPNIRIFQALSSRILEPDKQGLINEKSLLSKTQNAYDQAKRDSYEKVVLEYRKRGFFIASGFLCNHESPRRGERFVTGKIAKYVAGVARGDTEVLQVGNLEAKRDWSFAGDVVRGVHATLQVSHGQDYVIGSGTLHTVKEFIEIAFWVIGSRIFWKGEGTHMKGYDEKGVLRVAVSEKFYQPDDNPVVGDPGFLMKETGWKPEVSFEELVTMMVKAELHS